MYKGYLSGIERIHKQKKPPEWMALNVGDESRQVVRTPDPALKISGN